MKKLNISQSTHPATFKKCKNLGQLIALVEKQGELESLYVTKISLNGDVMDQDEECLLESLSINEVKSLTVEFSTINELIRNSMTDLVTSIQVCQTQAISFAKDFRTQQSVDDEKIKFVLIQCRGIIDSLEEIFIANRNQKIRLKHLSLWSEAEKELTNILQCILQGRKLDGIELIADLIEYDLVQALDQWEEVIEKELIENSSLNGIFSLKKHPQGSDNGVDV